MDLKNIFLYFVTGGALTTLIVILEQSGLRLLSGFATIMPSLTLITYFFIGQSQTGQSLSQHVWLTLIGTLVAWVPYMITIALLSPHMPNNKAIALGIIIFLVTASIYLLIVSYYHLFQ